MAMNMTDSSEYYGNEVWHCKKCNNSWGHGCIPGGPLVYHEVEQCDMCQFWQPVEVGPALEFTVDLKARLIPKDKIQDQRFGQMLVNALRLARRAGDTQQRQLFYLENDELERIMQKYLAREYDGEVAGMEKENIERILKEVGQMADYECGCPSEKHAEAALEELTLSIDWLKELWEIPFVRNFIIDLVAKTIRKFIEEKLGEPWRSLALEALEEAIADLTD